MNNKDKEKLKQEMYALANAIACQSEQSLWVLYSQIEKVVVEQGWAKSGSIRGTLGERLIVNLYNTRSDTPDLEASETNSRYLDAVERDNPDIKYQLKMMRGRNRLCTFHYKSFEEKIFDRLVAAVLDEDFGLIETYEFDYEIVKSNVKQVKGETKWQFRLTKDLKKQARRHIRL